MKMINNLIEKGVEEMTKQFKNEVIKIVIKRVNFT